VRNRERRGEGIKQFPTGKKEKSLSARSKKKGRKLGPKKRSFERKVAHGLLKGERITRETEKKKL